ncbi:MAG: EpsD family peptidyl-prolyl cis-trans isomerase [Alphaproteobacteria bacterium]
MRRLGAMAFAATFGLVLSACSEDEAPETPKSQVVANVNGYEVTVNELRSELEALNIQAVDPEDQKTISEGLLRRIVGRTVLAQQARQIELNRTPDVQMALRRARDQVLAYAYLKHRLTEQLPVSPVDLANFIEQNPHYFQARKQYVFDQIIVERSLVNEQMEAYIDEMTDFGQLEAALDGWNVSYSKRLNTIYANQLPKDMVQGLDDLGPAEMFVMRTDESLAYSKIIAVENTPIEGKDARQVAEYIISSQRNTFRSQRIIDQLIFNSRIDLFGDFSDVELLMAQRREEIQRQREQMEADGGAGQSQP